MEKRNVPEVRFKGFSDEWINYRFGDVSTVKSCRRIYKYETFEDEDIPFYKIGTFGSNADAFITRKQYEEYRNKYSYPNLGDILISASGTLGRTIEYRGEEAYFQDSNIIWLDINKKVIKNKYLKQLYEIIKWNSEGSTIKRLYNDNILSTKIILPKIQEQEKIGQLFESIDKMIEAQTKLIEENKKLKKSLLQKMFPKKGEKLPELRLKGFSGEWEEKKLLEIANPIEKKNNTYNLDNRDIPILSISASKGWVNQKERFGKIIAGNELKNYILLNKNELSYNKGNSKTAKYGIVFCMNLYDYALVPKVYHSFSTKENISNHKFIEKLFRSNIPNKELSRIVETTARFDGLLNVSKDNFFNIKLSIPNIQEQEKIGQLFESIDNMIEAQTKLIENYKSLKKSLLQKMFI